MRGHGLGLWIRVERASEIQPLERLVTPTAVRVRFEGLMRPDGGVATPDCERRRVV